jgi:hypothetical protein
MGETRRIAVRTDADRWTFTERNVPLWDLLDFFPADCVGPRGPADAPRPYEVRPIHVDTDLGFGFDTDIQYGSWIFRPRSPKQPGMMRWCREHVLQVGDAIVFERVDERSFVLRLERPAQGPGPADETA